MNFYILGLTRWLWSMVGTIQTVVCGVRAQVAELFLIITSISLRKFSPESLCILPNKIFSVSSSTQRRVKDDF